MLSIQPHELFSVHFSATNKIGHGEIEMLVGSFRFGGIQNAEPFLNEANAEIGVFGDAEIGIEGTASQNQIATHGNVARHEKSVGCVNARFQRGLRKKERMAG